jgi:hypothetical protein
LGYDPNQFRGLLDPVDIAKAKQQAILGTGLGLLNAGGRSLQPINFGQAFAQAAMMGQQQGQQSLQQGLALRQAVEAKARREADAQRQAALQDALRRGDIGAAAAIDPQFANQYRQATQPERVPEPMSVSPGGAVYDPVSRKLLYQAPFRPEPGQGAPAGFRYKQDGSLEPIPGGPSDPSVPKPLSPEAQFKLAQYQNAKKSADSYLKLVLDQDGNFNDWAARSPEAQRLLEDAVASKLRGDSGGAISNEEIQNETKRWAPVVFSADKTNADAVKRLVEQVSSLSSIGSGAQPAPPDASQSGAPLVPTQGVGRSFTSRAGAKVTIQGQ